jgi:hypothetical protein
VFRHIAVAALGEERGSRVSLHAARHVFGLGLADLRLSSLLITQALGHRSPLHALRYTQRALAVRDQHPGALLEAHLLGDRPGIARVSVTSTLAPQ